jgi:hypothetical protein
LEGGPPGFPRDTTCPAVLTASVRSPHAVAYRTLTVSGRPFQRRSADVAVCALRGGSTAPPHGPFNPAATSAGRPPSRAGLGSLPRSLAATGGLVSLPRGTQMFHFPRCPPLPLCVQGAVSGHHPAGVAPFGNPRITACPRLPEAFRRLATSFVGPRRLGIHRVPFMWITLNRPRLVPPRVIPGLAPVRPSRCSHWPRAATRTIGPDSRPLRCSRA